MADSVGSVSTLERCTEECPSVTVERSDGTGAVDEVYRGSDGRYYTAWQLEQNIETARWKPCLHETETGRRLVSVGRNVLLFLTPVDVVDLPPWVVIDVYRGERRVIDRRRELPPACSWSLPNTDCDPP